MSQLCRRYIGTFDNLTQLHKSTGNSKAEDEVHQNLHSVIYLSKGLADRYCQAKFNAFYNRYDKNYCYPKSTSSCFKNM